MKRYVRQPNQHLVSGIFWDELSTRPRKERAVLRALFLRAERFSYPPTDLRKSGAVVLTEVPRQMKGGGSGVRLDVVYASSIETTCDKSWSVTTQTNDELSALVGYVVVSDALLGFPAKIVGSLGFTLLFEELLAERP